MCKRIISVFAVLCVTGGCTVVHTSRFRVVDSSDGRPIEGVRAVGSCDWPAPPFSTLHCGPHYATSDSTGLVQFDEMGEDEVIFEKEGYEPCAIVAAWPGYRRRNAFFSRHTFPWEDDRTPIIHLQPRKRE